ncbi:hypothetical protein [Streptomyces sp. MAR25Y5]|uniref:hypothetical protein n=1 Tax=Streptomyces sp. MAR25Y5 TaxID=2962028 RepID=UPI0020B6FA8C|nr:hypothetical protein [Streptomyces sp. MAR25Y5]MCP3767697.1 hypothetical protein [Streptomyces sp. MAR25Y5]
MSPPTEVFVWEPDGDVRRLDVPEDFHQSAGFESWRTTGFESWRTTVWGSMLVRSPGARFLPVPADGKLEVEADQVPGFLREIALLRAHLDPIAFGTRHPRTAEEHGEQIRLRRGSARRPLCEPWGSAAVFSSGDERNAVAYGKRRPARAATERGGGRDEERDGGDLGPSPRDCAGSHPISSSALPFVSLTNFRTNGMESAAKNV